MRPYKIITALLIIFPLPFLLFGQDKTIDSLKFALKNAKHDTIRCKILSILSETASDDVSWPKYNQQLLNLCESKIKSNKKPSLEHKIYLVHYALALNSAGYLAKQNGDIFKALEYHKHGLKILQEIGDKKEIAQALHNIGIIYYNQGDILNALEYYKKSLELKKELGDKKGIAQSLNNIGVIYKNQGDIAKALEFYSKSLKIREEIGDKRAIAESFNNMGVIYNSQGDISKTLEYLDKSLKTYEEIGDKEGVARSLNNIGAIYNNQNDIPKALEYYDKSLAIREKIKDKSGVANSLISIGSIYFTKGDIKKALENYEKSLIIREEIGDKNGIASSLQSLGKGYYALGNLNEGLVHANRSLTISKELGYPENIKNSAELLKRIFQKQNKYKQAYEMYELEIKMTDSINNGETQKTAVKKQLQYTYEKKAALDSTAHSKETDIKNAEITARKAELKVKQNTQYALYGFLALALVFAGFIFNRFKVTQKQKQIIEIKEKETQQQKQIIEEKHKEITDSINYAERIQRSFLATEQHLNKHLSDYFILFKPKDVVSGDFYWSATLNDGKFALVTADSTGHGVPGAIMSLLNITSLEKAIETLTEPAEIFNAARKTIIDRLKRDGSVEGGKDGMDASITVYDFKNKKLTIAAAHNPIWIIRGTEVIEKKADKMPIGKHEKDTVSFNQQEFTLQDGDVIYTLTDGFADQFGGQLGKKFMSKNLRELLSKNAHLPMQQQKTILETTFKDWVGDLEHVDDVTIIGVRV